MVGSKCRRLPCPVRVTGPYMAFARVGLRRSRASGALGSSAPRASAQRAAGAPRLSVRRLTLAPLPDLRTRLETRWHRLYWVLEKQKRRHPVPTIKPSFTVILHLGQLRGAVDLLLLSKRVLHSKACLQDCFSRQACESVGRNVFIQELCPVAHGGSFPSELQ